MAKVPHGGWFALVIAGAVFAFSFTWWWGSNTKNNVLIATQVIQSSFNHALHTCQRQQDSVVLRPLHLQGALCILAAGTAPM